MRARSPLWAALATGAASRCRFDEVENVQCGVHSITKGEAYESLDEAFELCDADDKCDAVFKGGKDYRLCWRLGTDNCGRPRLYPGDSTVYTCEKFDGPAYAKEGRSPAAYVLFLLAVLVVPIIALRCAFVGHKWHYWMIYEAFMVPDTGDRIPGMLYLTVPFCLVLWRMDPVVDEEEDAGDEEEEEQHWVCVARGPRARVRVLKAWTFSILYVGLATWAVYFAPNIPDNSGGQCDPALPIVAAVFSALVALPIACFV